MANRKTPRRWSYSAGEWGRTRVRAFDRGAKGMYLEFFEPDPETGRRRRVRLALGHVDRETAKRRAEEVALAFRAEEPGRPRALTLRALFDTYEAEVTIHKAPSTQRHDRRCFEMFCRFWGAERAVKTLSRVEWDRFIAARRRGAIAPAKAMPGRGVRNRIIESDLRLLNAVLNWATVAGDGTGGVLLERNPCKGFPIPKEESPARPVLTAEQYAALRAAARLLGPRAELFVVLVHETGHRAASVRQLRWSDVDLERKMVTWRAENDKIGYGHQTPLTDEAVTMLQAERARVKAIGDAWLFPARRGDRTRCLSAHAARHLWGQLARRAGLPTGQRLGWHSLRRKFANELRTTNLKDLTALGGWKSPQTVLTVYMQPDEATQRAALAQRGTLRRAEGI